MKQNKHIALEEDLWRPVEKKAGRKWWIAMVIALLLMLYGLFTIIQVFVHGLGVLGLNQYIFWGIIITNFVFWIGVSHAGTFISAILLLLRQKWRLAINRSAEAMTIITIIIAALMPIIHLGKPDEFYQILPVPTRMGYQLVNFASPLSWDFYAIMTYLILSVIFFHFGLLPDLGLLRDRSTKKNRFKCLQFLSFGWNGHIRQWQNHKQILTVLAALITPLVISVHSIVSLDFAVTINPGWHSSLYPIYFVVGAIFSGFALVLTLVILLKRFHPAGKFIKKEHLEKMIFILLTTNALLIFIFCIEMFNIGMEGSGFDRINFMNKVSGVNSFWFVIFNLFILILPLSLWTRKLRLKINWLLFVVILANIGMWLERFFIVISSAERNFLLSSWNSYKPTFYDFGLILGSLGLFTFLALLVMRFIPIISVYELKSHETND